MFGRTFLQIRSTASLNLAAAVQIFSYELRMATETSAPASPPEFEPAAMEDVERLYEHFERTMIASGFVDPRQPKRLLARLRRLLARARLEIEEVNILRGFLKSVQRPQIRVRLAASDASNS